MRFVLPALALFLVGACEDAATARAKIDARTACEQMIGDYSVSLGVYHPISMLSAPLTAAEQRRAAAFIPRALRAGSWIDETRGDHFQFRWPDAEVVAMNDSSVRSSSPIICAGMLWDREVTLLSIGGRQQQVGGARSRF